MIGIVCRGIIGLVTVDAFDPQWSEQEEIGGSIGMTIKAIGGLMGSCERETASPVDIHDIGNHPVDRCMAPGTIGPHGLVVNVGVAIHALFSGFAEVQGLMTLPATDRLMLARKGKLRLAMVEGQGFEVDFPTGRVMAILAGQPELIPMGRLLCHNH